MKPCADIKKKRLNSQNRSSKALIDTQKIDEILWAIVDRKFEALKSEIKNEIATHLVRYSFLAKTQVEAQHKQNVSKTAQRKQNLNKSLLKVEEKRKHLFDQSKVFTHGKREKHIVSIKKDFSKTFADQRLKSRSMTSSMNSFKSPIGNKWLLSQQPQASKTENRVLTANNGTLILDNPIEDLYHSIKNPKAERSIITTTNLNDKLYFNDFEPPSEHQDHNVLNHSFEDFLSVKKDSNKKPDYSHLKDSACHTARISNYSNFQNFLNSQKDKINDSTYSATYQPASFRNTVMETIPEYTDVVNSSMILVEENIEEDSAKSKSEPLSSSNTGNSHYVFGKANKALNKRESIKDHFERRESLLKTTGMLFTFERKQRTSIMDLSAESKEIQDLEL